MEISTDIAETFLTTKTISHTFTPPMIQNATTCAKLQLVAVRSHLKEKRKKNLEEKLKIVIYIRVAPTFKELVTTT
jgi:hypothetical protein